MCFPGFFPNNSLACLREYILEVNILPDSHSQTINLLLEIDYKW